MDLAKDIKNLLSIKVLRLVRPTFVGPLALTCDQRDLCGNLWERELKTDVTSLPNLELLSLGNFLRLPQGFGNMYLGETFSSYVCIQNETPIIVANVTAKVELQTTTQKFVLSDTKSLSEMKTGNTLDLIMHHEVKELGKHMLICTLTYTVPNQILPPGYSLPPGGSNEAITLERFFKFQVKKPLDVKTKLYNAESDEVYLEAQVQNITTCTICLERVVLEPSSAFNCIPMDLEHCGNIPPAVSDPIWKLNEGIGKEVLLEVDSSHQFLYRLIPKVEHARSATAIGKLDIVWRSAMGDRGRLQTSQLQRQTPVLNDLKIIIEKIPITTTVDQPFSASCKLVNTTSDREMDLELELLDGNKGSSWEERGYCWTGLTKTKLGSLTGSNFLSLPLSILPLRTGLINISGIRITDINKGEKFLFNEVVQVLITSET